VQVLLDPCVVPVVLAFGRGRILRMIVALVSQPQCLPRSPTLNLRSGILLVVFGLVIRLASGRREFWLGLDRILVSLSGFGVFWLDVVLDKNTILVFEFEETT